MKCSRFEDVAWTEEFLHQPKIAPTMVTLSRVPCGASFPP